MDNQIQQPNGSGTFGAPAPNPAYTSGPTTNYTPPKSRNEGWRSIAATVLILLSAPLLAFLLTVFVFQTYQVDGPSMRNTLESNDRLIIWKFNKTWANLTGKQYIPKRLDVVVFSEPTFDGASNGKPKQLIKRVIGLPGERVVVSNGRITIYNGSSPNGFNPDDLLSVGTLATETFGEEDTTIPEGHIFVAGDNRSNSLDSRSFGPISAESIVGKLTFRVLPFNEAQRF